MGLYAPDGGYNVTITTDAQEGNSASDKVADPDADVVTVLGLLRGILEQLIAINTNTGA